MTDEPSNLEKAKFFSKTAYDILKGFVSNGNLMVPPEVKKARIDICRECNRFDEDRHLCRAVSYTHLTLPTTPYV